MDVQRLRHFGSAALVGLLSVPTTAAPVGRPAYEQPVTVVGYDAERLTKQVPYGDLALTTSEGRDTLLHRVGQAVSEVCPIFDEHGSVYDAQDCRAFAWIGAHQQIKQAINLARSGSKVAMAIEVAGPVPR